MPAIQEPSCAIAASLFFCSNSKREKSERGRLGRLSKGFTTGIHHRDTETQRGTETSFKMISVPLCALCASVVNPHG
jgi:hypothetical protein